MKNKVPKDILVLCEYIARGYERRKKDYENRRTDIIYHSSAGYFADRVGGGGGSKCGNVSDPSARKAELLEKLENSLEARFMKAVERALAEVGGDVTRDSREKLRKAIMLNCESGRDYPYEVLNIDEFSRRDFYRRRRRFIVGIGEALELIQQSDF